MALALVDSGLEVLVSEALKAKKSHQTACLPGSHPSSMSSKSNIAVRPSANTLYDRLTVLAAEEAITSRRICCGKDTPGADILCYFYVQVSDWLD